MPNTLAHLGAQALATRAIVPRADPKWIYAGAVVPDVPWIMQRAVRTIVPTVDPYDLRLYAVAQASLVVSLLLCGALAALSTAPRRAMVIVSMNALFHLLLDGIQTKWANGVHLFAPFSWELWNAGWWWPESLPTYLLTAFGAAFVAWTWWRRAATPIALSLTSWYRVGTAAILLTAYFIVPFALRGGPEAANNHFVATLRDRDARTHRYVEFDRSGYVPGEHADVLDTFAREQLQVLEPALNRPATVSARATFLDDSTIVIHELHDHSGWPRDLLTYVGLVLVAVAWVPASRRKLRDLGDRAQQPPG